MSVGREDVLNCVGLAFFGDLDVRHRSSVDLAFGSQVAHFVPSCGCLFGVTEAPLCYSILLHVHGNQLVLVSESRVLTSSLSSWCRNHSVLESLLGTAQLLAAISSSTGGVKSSEVGFRLPRAFEQSDRQCTFKGHILVLERRDS